MEQTVVKVRRKPLPHGTAVMVTNNEIPIATHKPTFVAQANQTASVKIEDDSSSTLIARSRTQAHGEPPGLLAVWWFELLSCIGSLLAIVAIVVVLRAYDGKRLTDWNLHLSAKGRALPISPNFVVSLLGTLSKSTLAVAVSAALSQAKWNWYSRHGGDLKNYRQIDEASRGPLGSVKLLWSTRVKHLASVGAAITILGLSFDPFLQLLLSYPGSSPPIEDSSIQIARAESFSQGSKSTLVTDLYNGIGLSVTSPANEIIAAVNNGLWSASSRQNPQQNCLGGNCTWPSYVSLSICSKCFNITEKLSFSRIPKGGVLYVDTSCYQGTDLLNVTLWPHKNVSYFNPTGFAKNCGWDTIMSSTSVPNNTINFKQSQTLLFSLAMIRAAPSYLANETMWINTKHEAIECGLSVCAITYNSTTENGKLWETITESTSNKKPDSWIADASAVKYYNETTEQLARRLSNSRVGNRMPLGSLAWNPLFIGDLYAPPRTDFEIELSPDQKRISGRETFSLTQTAIESTAIYLASTFGQSGGTSQRGGKVVYDPVTMRALTAASSLEQLFSNIAHDMTSAIRSMQSSSTQGLSTDWHVIISIRWPFVVMPVLLSISSLLYLISTIIQTRNVGVTVWKDNALASLVYGLDNEARTQYRDMRSPHELADLNKMKVRLEAAPGGPELVSQN